MKKMKFTTMLALILTLSLLIPASIWGAQPDKARGKAGTTLAVEKTAEGFVRKEIKYDWQIHKSSNVQNVTVDRGDSATIQYTLQADRLLLPEHEVAGVKGFITVTNGGDRATEGLTIVDQVQYKNASGPFQDLPGATLTIVPEEQLQPGETKSYAYEITFSSIQGAIYRNKAKVTITNHSGHLDESFGPEPKADFNLQNTANPAETDENAALTDSFACPSGFNCEMVGGNGTWQLTGTQTIVYSIHLKNVSAPCKSHFSLSNVAKLTEGDTSELRTSSNTIDIYSGCDCGCKP